MGDVQFDDEGGEGDTMVVERERDLALSAQARQTIADIDAALERLTHGHLRLLARVRPARSRASGSRRSRGPPCSSRRRSAGSAADDRDARWTTAPTAAATSDRRPHVAVGVVASRRCSRLVDRRARRRRSIS